MSSSWIEKEPWRENAACFGQDMNIWFPDDFYSAQPAKDICYECPVRRDCLFYAITTRTTEGVWGGFYGQEIMKKGRKFLDHPDEFIKGRRESHLRVASNRRVVPQRHDNPQRNQQASAG